MRLLTIFLTLWIYNAHADLITPDGAGGVIILKDSTCTLKLPELFTQGAENSKATIYQAEHMASETSTPDLACWYSPVPTEQDIADFHEQALRRSEDSPARSPDEEPVKIRIPVNIYHDGQVETLPLDTFKPVEQEPQKIKDSI